MIIGDDACDGEQAVALANKFVSDGVVFVAGHPCSEASIAASPVYAAAGILMISPVSTNPTLTERGLTNVFRVVGRDDVQGIMAGNYLADHWGDRQIAISMTAPPTSKAWPMRPRSSSMRAVWRRRCTSRSSRSGRLWGSDRPGGGAGIDVVYFPAATPRSGLFIRQARNRGHEFQLVTGDNNATESFRHDRRRRRRGHAAHVVPRPA